MSARLAMRVWESALPPHLKALAGVMALFANDEGENIYPSVGRLAWLVSKTDRRVRADLTSLINMGVLIPTTARDGGGAGRGRSTRYELDVSALPVRAQWNRKPGRTHQGSLSGNPDADVRVPEEKPGHFEQITRTPVTETLTPVTENPDVHVRRAFRDLLEREREEQVNIARYVSELAKRLLSQQHIETHADLCTAIREQIDRDVPVTDEEIARVSLLHWAMRREYPAQRREA
jgi:hypothetical protein